MYTESGEMEKIIHGYTRKREWKREEGEREIARERDREWKREGGGDNDRDRDRDSDKKTDRDRERQRKERKEKKREREREKGTERSRDREREMCVLSFPCHSYYLSLRDLLSFLQLSLSSNDFFCVFQSL